MKQTSFLPKTIILVALIVTTGMSSVVMAQDRRVFSGEKEDDAKKARSAAPAGRAQQLSCRGPIRMVTDIADENTRFTPANFFTMPGGGEGGGFDKTPLLTTRVSLKAGCLNAHLDAIVGSQLYGVAGLTMFQVTLTPTGGGPRHMVGHFEHPFGSNSPAVATEAERDVDMFAANFFQKVGNGPHEVPPGVYRVDVWWSGAGPGGAIAFSAVLKLYQQ
ncbi:MAG TPA: hypothetical protein VJU84_16675 [Pyrinomonadaceae bacterium]|nr:hypothetical protein [Pyrinomonadaceae bacterium]